MLRDNLVGLIEPMFSSAGANPLALCIAENESSDDRPPCLENPRPEGAESTLTENAASPFQAEPRHSSCCHHWRWSPQSVQRSCGLSRSFRPHATWNYGCRTCSRVESNQAARALCSLFRDGARHNGRRRLFH